MTPELSVILPTHGPAPHLPAQLDALDRQEATAPWELLVVDDRLRPEARRRLDAWAAPRPHVRVLTSPRPGCAAARNAGMDAARADRFAFCDDDDVVAPSWVGHVLAVLEHADLVAGALLSLGGATLNQDALRPKAGFLPRASTANMALRRSVVDRVGGFDESLVRSSDAEFCWRAQLAGVPLVHEPTMVVAKRPRPTAAQVAAQSFSWGRAEATLYLRYRDRGMARASIHGGVFAVGRHLVRLVGAPDRDARTHELRRLAFRLGRWRGSVQERVLYP